jgi:DNA-binding response OmpR family regulator
MQVEERDKSRNADFGLRIYEDVSIFSSSPHFAANIQQSADPMRKVLIIEDDQAMAVALRDGFNYEGYRVEVARDGAIGLRLATDKNHDLIILDVMLPKLCGLDVCKRLRAGGHQTPIIMLSARGQEIDKVVGLKTGADDYVTKPFSPRELLARVRAALRRTARTGSSDLVSFGDISADFTKMEVLRNGEPVQLTAQEFKTLRFMAQNAERVISRDELLNEVWGYQNYPSTRTVDNHILKLRQKLERDPGNPVHFRTVHGMGYKFVP